ncbi:MAG: lipocalin family protein [Desulfuromonas sp.]|nr:lipocalin family protein [Desulfuromonas sp.]
MTRWTNCTCRRFGSLLGFLAMLAGCAPPQGLPPLKAVERVDLQRYMGTWYEIASYPHRFQKGCVASRADYELQADGRVKVVNQCREERLDGPLRKVEGTARVVDSTSNARLEVTFFWPFWGGYWIIAIDPDYRWAVVGHPSRNYLWILSRTPAIDEAAYQKIVATLPSQGYDPGRLQRTLQPQGN